MRPEGNRVALWEVRMTLAAAFLAFLWGYPVRIAYSNTSLGPGKRPIFAEIYLQMGRVRITKQFSFEAGHALYGYDGKCRNVHGHSYKLRVTVIGEPISDQDNVKYGMVIDFGDLKKIVKEKIVDVFDHATVFNRNTPHVELARELEKRDHKVILVDYQPTSENMIQDFARIIQGELPSHIELFSLRLQETESSYAEWYATDNVE